MTKKAIIVSILVILIVAALGWWGFTRTNSVTSQLNGSEAKIKSSEKTINSFALSGLSPSGISEVIDNTKHTITLITPSGTDITKLVPIISVSGSTISPASGVAQNFTKPVDYTVTAQDGSTQKYTITVKTATSQGTGGS
ncbi:MAG: DUF5018 domain-containing protein [Candidatus Staskawiczbacteria bacterium]|nr:DUF5018 domain-containing protein [Candidatus Staskawiczbacteria bacterium]